MKARQLVEIAGVSLICGLPMLSPAQSSQSVLAQQTASADAKSREGAFALSTQISPDRVTSELRQALFAAARRAGDAMRARHTREVRGLRTTGGDEADQSSAIFDAIARLDDPGAASALASLLYGGSGVARALARHGNEGALATIIALREPDALPETLSGGLIALRMAVESRGARPLSAATVAQIRSVAAAHLAAGSVRDASGVALGRHHHLDFAPRASWPPSVRDMSRRSRSR